MKAIVFAVLAGLCWGVGELLTKSALHGGRVGPLAAVLVRCAAALPLACIAYGVGVTVLKSEPGDWFRAGGPTLAKLLLGSGVLAGFGGVLFFYLGLKFGDISLVKPIAFTLGPAVAVVLAWIVLREPMNWAKALGVILVLAGVVLIAGLGPGASRTSEQRVDPAEGAR